MKKYRVIIRLPGKDFIEEGNNKIIVLSNLQERDLMNEGYKIMRFSGREIVRDVEKCVEEVIDYFLKPG